MLKYWLTKLNWSNLVHSISSYTFYSTQAIPKQTARLINIFQSFSFYLCVCMHVRTCMHE